MFNINDMRSNLVNGGARPQFFQVQITNPIVSSADQKFSLSCMASSIPAYTLGVIKVPYFGRTIGIPGQKEFENWSTTVIMDNDYLVRDALESWHNAMNSQQGNLNTISNNPNDVKTQGTITKFDLQGNAVRVYTVVGLFPIVLGASETSWEEGTQLETLQVTWNVDDFFVSGATGTARGV